MKEDMNEVNLDEARRIIFQNFKVTHTTQYEDGEYRMMYFKMIDDLMKIFGMS